MTTSIHRDICSGLALIIVLLISISMSVCQKMSFLAKKVHWEEWMIMEPWEFRWRKLLIRLKGLFKMLDYTERHSACMAICTDMAQQPPPEPEDLPDMGELNLFPWNLIATSSSSSLHEPTSYQAHPEDHGAIHLPALSQSNYIEDEPIVTQKSAETYRFKQMERAYQLYMNPAEAGKVLTESQALDCMRQQACSREPESSNSMFFNRKDVDWFAKVKFGSSTWTPPSHEQSRWQ